MRKLLVSFVFMMLGVLALAAPLSKAEIYALVRKGESSRNIIQLIQRQGVDFKMDANTVVEMNKLVSNDVLRALMAASSDRTTRLMTEAGGAWELQLINGKRIVTSKEPVVQGKFYIIEVSGTRSMLPAKLVKKVMPVAGLEAKGYEILGKNEIDKPETKVTVIKEGQPDGDNETAVDPAREDNQAKDTRRHFTVSFCGQAIDGYIQSTTLKRKQMAGTTNDEGQYLISIVLSLKNTGNEAIKGFSAKLRAYFSDEDKPFIADWISRTYPEKLPFRPGEERTDAIEFASRENQKPGKLPVKFDLSIKLDDHITCKTGDTVKQNDFQLVAESVSCTF